jgi:hypothetical protein
LLDHPENITAGTDRIVVSWKLFVLNLFGRQFMLVNSNSIRNNGWNKCPYLQFIITDRYFDLGVWIMDFRRQGLIKKMVQHPQNTDKESRVKIQHAR